jgi:hypothetical protein
MPISATRRTFRHLSRGAYVGGNNNNDYAREQATKPANECLYSGDINHARTSDFASASPGGATRQPLWYVALSRVWGGKHLQRGVVEIRISWRLRNRMHTHTIFHSSWANARVTVRDSLGGACGRAGGQAGRQAGPKPSDAKKRNKKTG